MKEFNNQEIEAIQGVSSIYLLLASLFKDVASLDLLQHLKDPQILGVLEDLGCSFDNDFLVPEINEDFVETMAYDFTQLFIGPAEFISPYESIFHERDDDDWGKLWGADTVKVKKFMESAGLEFSSDYGGIPDHISVELEFLGHVTAKIEEAVTNENHHEALYFLKMKKLFFDEHLTRWIPAFCEKSAAKATTSLYREIAYLLDSFIQIEDECVAKDIETMSA